MVLLFSILWRPDKEISFLSSRDLGVEHKKNIASRWFVQKICALYSVLKAYLPTFGKLKSGHLHEML